MSEMILIHITGPSGAGKSFLGKCIKKKFPKCRVLDTDEVDDRNAMDALKKSSKIDRDKVKIKNTRDFVDIILAKNTPIVFTGRTIDLPAVEELLRKKPYKTNSRIIVHKFCIDIDDDTLFRQVNTRHAESIANNIKEILTLLTSKKSTFEIEKILKIKYKIRLRFPLTMELITKNLKEDKIKMKKEGYKLLAPDAILDSVEKIFLQHKS